MCSELKPNSFCDEVSFACNLEVCYVSASGVTDMGLFKSFDVLCIKFLGEVQESTEY